MNKILLIKLKKKVIEIVKFSFTQCANYILFLCISSIVYYRRKTHYFFPKHESLEKIDIACVEKNIRKRICMVKY